MDKKISRKDLLLWIKMATIEELEYTFNRYCGPHHILLRGKVYEYDAAKDLTKIISDELAYRAIDNMLLTSDN